MLTVEAFFHAKFENIYPFFRRQGTHRTVGHELLSRDERSSMGRPALILINFPRKSAETACGAAKGVDGEQK